MLNDIGSTPLWLAVVLLVIYFIPWGAAVTNGRKDVLSIFILNLFVGWTVIGWVLALVWACLPERKKHDT